MPEIKFDSNYIKLHGQERATLLAVEVRPLPELPIELLDYDLLSEDGKRREIQGKNVMVLILTFSGNLFIPFTTIRRSSTFMFLKYKSMIGQTFDIVIEKPDPVVAVQEELKAVLS
jgi:hypothetical protein